MSSRQCNGVRQSEHTISREGFFDFNVIWCRLCIADSIIGSAAEIILPFPVDYVVDLFIGFDLIVLRTTAATTSIPDNKAAYKQNQPFFCKTIANHNRIASCATRYAQRIYSPLIPTLSPGINSIPGGTFTSIGLPH